MKIIILGCTGMLGSQVFDYFEKKNYEIVGTFRNTLPKKLSNKYSEKKFLKVNDLFSKSFLDKLKDFDCIINCIGVIKQNTNINTRELFRINSSFPFQICQSIKNTESHFIHLSTDCVFSGNEGHYSETEIPNPVDAYGLSKLLGEVESKNSLVIRTSIIGHEINSRKSLIDWFLGQKKIKGFSRAYFSGLPTVEIAEILERYIIPKRITGLYHIAGNKISKYDLLRIVNDTYKANVIISKEETFNIDRSLNADKFNKLTNYQADDWGKLIEKMRISKI
mgnify:CR=1 FL=1|tara:strand:- start:7820 stop:8656 length:837 start_codon:yes stop_codon:yes gene_type:complete